MSNQMVLLMHLLLKVIVGLIDGQAGPAKSVIVIHLSGSVFHLHSTAQPSTSVSSHIHSYLQ